MATIDIRLGPPKVYLAKLAGDERTDEDFLKLQYCEVYTTGPIKFEEEWSKTQIVLTRTKLTSLGKLRLDLSGDDIVSLLVYMPPDSKGKQEVKRARYARVTKKAQIFSADSPETVELEITCSKDCFRSYDHLCETEHEERIDCKGRIKIDPNFSADYFIDCELYIDDRMKDFFNKVK